MTETCPTSRRVAWLALLAVAVTFGAVVVAGIAIVQNRMDKR